MVFLAVWRYGDDARWCANDKSAADHLSFHIRQTIPYCTVPHLTICLLIIDHTILNDSIPNNYSLESIIMDHTIPYNLSFDIKQTTQNYTIPHHTITYCVVPFVFWYQTARIWRIWQGPQHPVGILTPATKYKTTSSTCVSAFDQIEEEKKYFLLLLF